jgi:hypothetical protein
VTDTREGDALVSIRRWLLWTLAAGVAGTELELLLLGHFDSASQVIPLVLLACGAGCVGWYAVAPRRSSVRAMQAMMALFVASGVLGVALHYRGNVEFELEMYPAMRGFELMGKTLTGATPIFAPGSMVLLGLVGLACTHRHPALSGE